MVNQWQSERETLEWLMQKAKAEGNAEALGELSRVHIPFGSPDELYYHRRWLQLANGKNPFPKNYVRNWGKKWFALFSEACAINLFEAVPVIACPVYFFVGSSDRQASSTITEAYYKGVKAEKKELIWFTKSGHNLNLTEPNKFQETILGLLPR
jgi:pimeloyl-ACP methyl ester carboxylesterase